MISRNRVLSIAVAVQCALGTTHAQTKELRIEEFVQIVRQYHPIARQAELIPAQARAELLIARSGWDPQLTSDYARKSFDGNNYYSYFESAVKVPVWYGVEVKAGYDVAYGNRINSESKLPDDGVGYIGISVPLGSNLLFDKRRAALKNAQLFRTASTQQQLNMLNDLLLEAVQTYHTWSLAFAEQQLYANAVNLARQRFQATKQLSLLGDRPAIDTVEALTQLQSRQFQLNDARTRFLQTSFALSNFLWKENDVPAVWDSTIVPLLPNSQFLQTDLALTARDELETRLRTQHPQLQLFDWKLQQLEVERRLKLENLKPVLNAEYNVLSNRFNFQSNSGVVFANNYKFGLKLAMPLAFAQGRGDLKVVKLKTQSAQLDRNMKARELLNKFRSAFAEMQNLHEQTRLQQETVAAFQTLLDGEEERFRAGESSVFLVNARENRLIEAQQKLRELQAKYYQKEAQVKWSAGILGY